LLLIDKKFRGDGSEIKDVMEKTATDEELEGLLFYLLKNATEICNKQEIHYPMAFEQVRDEWDRHSKGLKKFHDEYIEHNVHLKTIKPEAYEAWLKYCNENGIKSKGRNKFYESFEDIVNVASMYTWIEDMRVHVYPGIRIRSKEEVESRKQQGLDRHMSDSK